MSPRPRDADPVALAATQPSLTGRPPPGSEATPPPSHALWTRGLIAASLVLVAYLFVNILMFRYGRDQGIYAAVADTVLRGGMPYRDAWDFKPPGIFIIYAATRATFGSGQWAIRLVEVFGLASVVGAFFLLARRFFGDGRIGIIGGALAVLVYAELEFWHTGQPESFGGILTSWALVLGTFEPSSGDARGRRKQLAAWSLAGVLYGFCFLLKPPLGGGVIVTAAYAAHRLRSTLAGRPLFERVRQLAAPFVCMALGSALIVAACALWFMARGAWHELYDTLFVFTPHYTKLSWEDATVPGMVYLAVEEWFIDLSSTNAVGLLAAFILPPIASRERDGVMHVLLVIAMQLVGVAMQGKFFPYHYGASVVLGAFIAGLGAYKLWQRAVAKGAWGVLVFGAALAIVLRARSATRNTQTDFFDRCVARQTELVGMSDMTKDELDAKLYSVADVSYDADRRVAEFLRLKLAPDELAFIWGFEPMIYDMSERRPATRFLYNVPQRVSWFRDRARSMLMDDLDLHPPKAIVVEHRDVFPAVTGDAIDSADTLRKFPALDARIHDGYDLATTIEDFDVYLRR
jgi:hypothetical protein